MVYLSILPSKEQARSYFFILDGACSTITVDECEARDTSITVDGAAIAWHNSTLLTNPFTSHVTMMKALPSYHARELRHAIPRLAEESHIAAFSCSEKAHDMLCVSEPASYVSALDDAREAGFCPNTVWDGNIAWYGLRAFLNLREQESVYLLGHGNAVIICWYEHGYLQEYHKTTWDEDIGDLTNFALTEIVPSLQAHGVLEKKVPLFVVQSGSQLIDDLVKILQNRLKVDAVTCLRVPTMSDLLQGCYQSVLENSSSLSVLAYQQTKELAFTRWWLLATFLFLITGVNLAYVLSQSTMQSYTLSQLSTQASEYQNKQSGYIAVLNDRALGMRSDFSSFFKTFACEIPEAVWFTGAAVQWDKQKLLLQGYMRAKINLHSYTDDLATSLGWDPRKVKMRLVDPSIFVDLVEVRQQEIQQGREQVLELFTSSKRTYDPEQRFDALSFQITNVDEGEQFRF